MKITLDREYVFKKVRLVLRPSSFPILEFEFDYTDAPSLETINQKVSEGNPVAFLWNDNSINFMITGIEKIDKRPISSLTGLVLTQQHLDWLKHCPNTDSHLIYQRTNGETGSGFFERLLNNQISLRDEERDRLEAIFPPFATLCRKSGEDNYHFMNKVSAYIRNHEISVHGWAAFNDKEPLRLISLKSGRPVTLNEDKWTPMGLFPNTVNRYAGSMIKQNNFMLKTSFTTEQPMELLMELVTLGKQIEHEIKGNGLSDKEKSQLIVIPGPVVFREVAYFCSAIHFEFDSRTENNNISINVQLEQLPVKPISSPFPIRLVKSRFSKWIDNKYAGLKFDQNDNTQKFFVVKHPETPDPEILYSHVVSPAPVRENYHGVYFRYCENDMLLCLLDAGNVPVVLGGYQEEQESFGNFDIIINLEKIAMTVTPKNIKPEESKNSIRMDGKEKTMAVQSEKKIDIKAEQETSINANKVSVADNMEITPEKTTIKKETVIKEKVTIADDLDVSKNLNVG